LEQGFHRKGLFFPLGFHDDQIDAMAGAFRVLIKRGNGAPLQGR
jgi:phage terminase large subunit-like protein